MKVRFGWGPIDGAAGMRKNVDLVHTVRETVGGDIDVMADAYMGWTLDYAKRMLPLLEPFNLRWLVTNHSWDWYLNQAYQTSIAMTKYAQGFAEFGQMEGNIFLQILADLKLEGMKAQADDLEARMRSRADRWKSAAYPFGSEMPWDSTGQEEVYAWTKYFGYADKADVTLNAILGCDPAIPHWGYKGSARRAPSGCRSSCPFTTTISGFNRPFGDSRTRQ